MVMAGRRRCLRMWWGKSPGSFNHLTSGRRSSGWNWQFVGFSKLSWSFTGGFWQFWYVLTGPTFPFWGKNRWLRAVFGNWYPGWMFKHSQHGRKILGSWFFTRMRRKKRVRIISTRTVMCNILLHYTRANCICCIYIYIFICIHVCVYMCIQYT